MKMKPLAVWVALLIVILATLWLSGCSSNTPTTPASQASPAVATTPPTTEPKPTIETTSQPAPAEETATETASSTMEPSSPSAPELVETPSETMPKETAEQPVLTWGRTAGGLNYCDRMSIYADGQVEAVVCRTSVVESTVNGTLSDEQLTQLLAWVAEYSSFTRRESEMSSAVRATTLNGAGDTAPDLAAKTAIAAFAANLYFSLTGTQ